nr:M20/M25/M40 family metallo-hydrolase [uncultured Brevundimonas sp.]
MRLILFIVSLAAALGLAVIGSQTPHPRSAASPAQDFAAERAMIDIRRIARAPHPVGSATHADVRAYLMQRMTGLGLRPEIQTGPLSARAARRIQAQGRSAAGLQAANLVGVLPGRDPGLPAVLMMAHYDSVPGSPSAADDATGVAAILEAVRAIKARGGADRTLIVLLTDAEELDLDGARAFFARHPLRERVGAVINLEARGGGGRAMMFETGAGNAQTIDRYAAATRRADGGASSNALAIFVYRLMPNGTDFTVAAQRGLPGINLAFIGRPDQYHSPASTPEALDHGSVQHIGSQALEMADVLLRAADLPRAGVNAVYADVFGMVVVRHPPVVGWLLLAAGFGAAALAGWGARRATGLRLASVGRGALGGVWLMAAAVVIGQVARVLAGPMGGRAASPDAYYTLLRRLPVLEVGAALAIGGLALALAAAPGMGRFGRRLMAAGIAIAAVVVVVMGGADRILIGAAVVGVALSLWPWDADKAPWGGWLGLVVLVLTMGVGVQVVAPEAAFLLIWPGLIAALCAAVAAVISARLASLAAVAPAALATVVVGGWLMMQGHGVFLGVGMDRPGVLGLVALLVMMLARPLAPTTLVGQTWAHRLTGLGLVSGCLIALSARMVA